MFHHYMWLQDPSGNVYRSNDPCYEMTSSQMRTFERAGFKLLKREPSAMYWYYNHNLKPKVQFVSDTWSLIAGERIQRGRFYLTKEFKDSVFFVHPGRPYYPVKQTGFNWHVHITNGFHQQWLPEMKK